MTYDTVFISDVHLGTDRCNTEKFLKFCILIKELMTFNQLLLICLTLLPDLDRLEPTHKYLRQIQSALLCLL